MACGSCGGARNRNVRYEITYKHDGSKEVVDSMADVRMKLAQSPQRGTYKPVPKTESK